MDLDELKRKEQEKDGDNAHDELMVRMTQPMIVSNLAAKVVDHPVKFIFCQILFFVLFIYMTLNFTEISPEQNRNFYMQDHPATINADKVILINAEIDALESGNPSTLDTYGRKLQELPLRQQNLYEFSIVYRLSNNTRRYFEEYEFMNLDNIAIIEGLEEHVRANYLKFCKLDEDAECTEDSLRSPIELIGDLESDAMLRSRLD